MSEVLIGYFVRVDIKKLEAIKEKDIEYYFNKYAKKNIDGNLGIPPNDDNDVLEVLNLEELKTLFHKLKECLFNDGANDIVFRKDLANDSFLWAFSGSLSYGEAPQGYAYEVLDKVYSYNLQTLFYLE